MSTFTSSLFAGSALAKSACVAAALLLPAGPALARAFSIDPKRTSISFTISAIGYPETRGYFRSFNGQLAIDLDNPGASRAMFTVRSNSISTNSSSLDSYIKSNFLESDKYPEMRFVSTQVQKLDQRTALVNGNLTLHGVTRPLAMRVDVNQKGGGSRQVLGFVARGSLNRADYGMFFGLPAVSNTVTITVSTEAAGE